MHVHYRWILAAVLVAGVLGYLLGTKNDHSDVTAQGDRVSRSGMTTKAPKKPRRAVARNRADQQAWTPRFPSDGYGRSDEFSYSPPSRDNRFRPDKRTREPIGRYEFGDSGYRRNGSGYFNSSPSYQSRTPSRRYGGRQLDSANRRFRPLEENEQTRRWRGNYQRMSISPAQLATPVVPGYHVTQLDPGWSN